MTEKEKLLEAIAVINKMQNLIRPYSFGSGVVGEAMNKAFNLGSAFNAKHGDLFQEYLITNMEFLRRRGD